MTQFDRNTSKGLAKNSAKYLNLLQQFAGRTVEARLGSHKRIAP
jgi:hypothetical protein